MKPMQIVPSLAPSVVAAATARATPPQSLVVAVLVVVQLVFSGWHVVGKAVLDAGTNPIVFALWRELLSALVIFCLAATRDGNAHGWLPERQHVSALALIGFLTFFSVVGFIVALHWVSPFNAAVLQPTIPVFTSAIAVASGQERARAGNTIGVCCSAIGALLVAWATEHKASGAHSPAPHGGAGDASMASRLPLIGNGILVAQCIASSWNCVLMKRVVRTYRPLWVTCWYYSIGAAFTATLAIALYGCGTGSGNATSRQDGSSVSLLLPPPSQARALWGALFYAVFAVTSFNYSAITWAIKHAPATQVALFSTLQPVATAAMAYIVLGSSVSIGQWAGGAFVCAGLWTSTRDTDTEPAGTHGGDDRKEKAQQAMDAAFDTLPSGHGRWHSDSDDDSVVS